MRLKKKKVWKRWLRVEHKRHNVTSENTLSRAITHHCPARRPDTRDSAHTHRARQNKLKTKKNTFQGQISKSGIHSYWKDSQSWFFHSWRWKSVAIMDGLCWINLVFFLKMVIPPDHRTVTAFTYDNVCFTIAFEHKSSITVCPVTHKTSLECEENIDECEPAAPANPYFRDPARRRWKGVRQHDTHTHTGEHFALWQCWYNFQLWRLREKAFLGSSLPSCGRITAPTRWQQELISMWKYTWSSLYRSMTQQHGKILDFDWLECVTLCTMCCASFHLGGVNFKTVEKHMDLLLLALAAAPLGTLSENMLI